jgi:hypothetical protein
MARPSVRSAVSSWLLCRRLELFGEASVVIDGSKFKAVSTRDRILNQAKMQRLLAQIDESIARYFSQLRARLKFRFQSLERMKTCCWQHGIHLPASPK